MSLPQLSAPKVVQTVKIGGVTGVSESAFGGGLEGAERTARETAMWSPNFGSPDQLINRVKPMADARGRDLGMNDGYAHGAIATHKDSIVGAHYRLNCDPSLKILALENPSFDETWLTEFQEVVEARYDLIAESDSMWLDASGMNTATGIIRLLVGGFVVGGEGIMTAEWLNKDRSRPCKTAVQLVSSARLSNPDNMPDTRYLRRGVLKDARGRPVGYNFRVAHPSENYDANSYSWRYVPARKPWGRQQVLHIFEQFEVDQTRGIADMVSALKHMRMTKVHSETTLQNAVINASYAAALESELPPEVVYGMMGGDNGADNFANAMGAHIDMLKSFFGGANNVSIDGAKVPVLPPGTKLQARSLATPGGVGTNFEDSLHRYVAAALGLSFEEYTRNWQGVSYSGGKMAASTTAKFMKARKKTVADRAANFMYSLWLEEEFNAGNVPLPSHIRKDFFYRPLMKEALCKATWIGAGLGQIDELKETQAAVLRVKAGFSTYEIEIARLGGDFRRIFAQAAREQGIISDKKLTFDLGASKPNNKLSATAAPKKAKAKGKDGANQDTKS